MKIEFNEYGIAGCVVAGICGVAALGIGLYSSKKTNEMAKTIGASVERIKGMTSVEVSDALVNETVHNKVERTVTQMVTDASRKAVDDVKSSMYTTIQREVQEAVRDRSSEIQSRLEKEIEDQIMRGININDFSRRVERNCEQKVMDQMNGAIERVTKLAGDKLSAQLSSYREVGDIVKGVLGK